MRRGVAEQRGAPLVGYRGRRVPFPSPSRPHERPLPLCGLSFVDVCPTLYSVAARTHQALYTTTPSYKAAHSVQQLRAVVFRNGGALSTLGVARPCPWSAVWKKESRVSTCVVLNATPDNGASSSTIVRYARRSVSYGCDADDCTGNTRELSRGSAERLRPCFGQQ